MQGDKFGSKDDSTIPQILATTTKFFINHVKPINLFDSSFSLSVVTGLAWRLRVGVSGPRARASCRRRRIHRGRHHVRRHPGPGLSLRLLGVVGVALVLGLLLLLLTRLRDGWIARLRRWLRMLGGLKRNALFNLDF